MKRKSEDPLAHQQINFSFGARMVMNDSPTPPRSTVAGFLLPILICALIVSTVRAEYAVSIFGTISDTSGLPLSGAHITIPERQTGAVSGWNGRYAISDLSPGTYTLIATFLGYHSEIKNSIAVFEGSPTHLNISLEPLRISRPEVLIKYDKNFLSAGVNQQVTISRQEWKLRGAASVGDVLRDIPGVSVREGDSSQRISLRGSPPRTVKVDLDGIPLNDAGTGEAEVGFIDIDQLSAIQVEFKGLGGEVHLKSATTDRLSRRPGTYSFSALRGSYGKEITRLSVEAGKDSVAGVAYFSRKSEDGDFRYMLDDDVTRFRYNNQLISISGMGGIEYRFGDQLSEMGVYYENMNRGIPGLVKSAPTPEAKLETKRVSGRISHTGRIDLVNWRLGGFVSEYDSRYESPGEQYNPVTDMIVYQYPEKNAQSGLRYGFSADSRIIGRKGELKLEYRYQYDKYRGEDLLRERVSIGGVGLGYAGRSLNRLELSGGWFGIIKGINYHLSPVLAAEIIDDAGYNSVSFISPSIAFSFEKILENLNLNLTTGWGRSLSAAPFNALFLVENSFAVGNKDLKPERGETFTTGITLSNRSDSFLRWRLNSLYSLSLVEDLIIWKRNSFGKYYPDNVKQVRTHIIEITPIISFFQGNISVSGSYIYNRAVNDSPGDVNFGNLTPLTAEHSGSAAVTLRSSGMIFTVRSRWVSRRYSTESNLDYLSTAEMGLSPYSVYDVNLGRYFEWQRLSFETELGVDNLFDSSYRIIERSPMPGRSYRLKLGVSI